MHHVPLASEILRWAVVAVGITTVIAVVWKVRQREYRLFAVFAVLVTTGITANYTHSVPVVFPGAVLYLAADGYVLWNVYRIDKERRE